MEKINECLSTRDYKQLRIEVKYVYAMLLMFQEPGVETEIDYEEFKEQHGRPFNRSKLRGIFKHLKRAKLITQSSNIRQRSATIYAIPVSEKSSFAMNTPILESDIEEEDDSTLPEATFDASKKDSYWTGVPQQKSIVDPDNIEETAPVEDIQQHVCQYCGRPCASRIGLQSHEKACRDNPNK